MTIDPRWGMWLSIILAIIGALAGASTQLTTIFGEHTASVVLAVAVLLLTVGNAVNAVLHAIPSQSGPAGAAQFALGPAIKAVIAFFVVMVALSFALPAHAQTRAVARFPAVAAPAAAPQFQFPQLPCDPLKLIPNCKSDAGSTEGPAAQTADGFSSLLQEIYDKIHSQGEAVIADMTKAQGIAQQKFSDGTEADAASDKCLAAAIPIVQLIVNNQLVPSGVTPAASGTSSPPPASGTNTASPAATPDGPITIFVKIRVVVNALQSPSLQSGCSWLQSSINQAGTQGLANVLAGLVGLTKLGVAIPGVAL